MSGSIDNKTNKIYTVAGLTAEIKSLLENNFPFVWVQGEISNFSVPASGHFYFTLKDEQAQISAVMFRGQNKNLKFRPESGMQVVGLGRISLYEPRGAYQVIFELLEPQGVGAFQIAFEQLKAKLAEEGLFDEKHKTPLPFLPAKISVVTSATGSVIHDILHVINRRFNNIPIEVLPVKVQGAEAVAEIVDALKVLNERKDSDVIILARGGGSLEDLAAFNSEDIARSIFASKIPIISAIGHETDFTIADFVADLRAPTPSAAAEMVVPVKNELLLQCRKLRINLINGLLRCVEAKKQQLEKQSNRLVDPRKKIQDLQLRLDDFSNRLMRHLNHYIRYQREKLHVWNERLYLNTPAERIKFYKEILYGKVSKLLSYYQIYINKYHYRLREFETRLLSLNPRAILTRGYSITRRVPDSKIIKSATEVRLGQEVEILLARGKLTCQVGGIIPDGEEDI